VLTPEQLLEHCLARPGAWPDYPWEHDYPVVKVADGRGAGKIFAFLGATTVGVKAGDNREEADEWLARYPDDAAVMAYIGRSGWNTLTVGGAIADEEVLEAVDESYARVVAKLPRKHRPEGWDRT
jgi:predicted DNA-binding protein (MmcQ/YjbR family)